jgi:hypothetical protein
LLSFLPDREFRRCVARYGGDARPRGFSCWDQYLSMAFAQLTYRDGLRDIEACLRSLGGKLYHHCCPGDDFFIPRRRLMAGQLSHI